MTKFTKVRCDICNDHFTIEEYIAEAGVLYGFICLKCDDHYDDEEEGK